MPNFLTSKKWPVRRIIGAILAPIVVFGQAAVWPDVTADGSSGRFLGALIGNTLWWYTLYLLLRDPDEPKYWHRIPSWLIGILFFAVLVWLLGLSRSNGV